MQANLSTFETLQNAAHENMGYGGIGVFNDCEVENAAIPVPAGPLPKMAEPDKKLAWLDFPPGGDSQALDKLQQDREINVQEYMEYPPEDLHKLVNFLRLQLRAAYNAKNPGLNDYLEEIDDQIREAIKRKR